MSDQQRWNSLGCNGNVFVQTPHLDTFAKLIDALEDNGLRENTIIKYQHFG